MTHRLSPAAEKDLDDIWLFLVWASGEIETADRFLDFLTERFATLSEFPYIGRRCDPTLDPTLRHFPVGEYIIFYRILEEDVLIARVIRGSRNLQDLL